MRRYGPARPALAAAALALALAAAGCGGGRGGTREVSQEGRGGYPWVATDEICNALPYGKLADPFGSREEVADRAKRSGGGAPGFMCTQPLVPKGGGYKGVKVEVDFAFTESVGFAKDVFASGRKDNGATEPAGGGADVAGVGREAYRFAYTKPNDLHQVRELRLRDSNLLLGVTVTADAPALPTPETLGAMDRTVDAFARGVLDTLRK
ncbi:hypothetical protein ABZY31_23580 [Streptomyces sp. NPDC006529]|uniref:hypothetical protein n=1 Tax=Streptomyces sp. NPDC006529 TaxID=3157177 RepID=UPI0033A9A303